jgi:hypothetical protein
MLRSKLSDTEALVRRGIRPQTDDTYMQKTRCSPLPPQEYPAGFARNSSPDVGSSVKDELCD